MREDWARRMSELLAPGGVLVCLEFPLWKGLSELGPPWSLKGVYWNLLAQGGDGRINEPPEEIEYPEGHHIVIIQFHRRAPLSPNVTRRNVLLVCKRFYVSRLIISLWSCHTDESTRSASVCRICMLSPSSGPAIIRNGYWTPWNNRQISLLTFASSG